MIGRIYLITNQLNGHCYVGKTYTTIQERWKEHIKTSKRENMQHRPLYRAINKYGIENFQISLIEETDNLEEREKYWIKFYNTYKNGYNATLGGDGKTYISYTEEEIISEYLQNLSIKETAQKFNISEDSVTIRLKNANIEIPKGGNIYNSKRNWQTHKVLQYSKKGEFLKEFNSASEAANFLQISGVTDSQIKHIVTNIGRCCKGERKTAYTFIWKFKDMGE